MEGKNQPTQLEHLQERGRAKERTQIDAERKARSVVSSVGGWKPRIGEGASGPIKERDAAKIRRDLSNKLRGATEKRTVKTGRPEVGGKGDEASFLRSLAKGLEEKKEKPKVERTLKEAKREERVKFEGGVEPVKKQSPEEWVKEEVSGDASKMVEVRSRLRALAESRGKPEEPKAGASRKEGQEKTPAAEDAKKSKLRTALGQGLSKRTEKAGEPEVAAAAEERRLPTARIDEVAPITHDAVHSMPKQQLEKALDKLKILKETPEERERLAKELTKVPERAYQAALKKVGLVDDRERAISRPSKATEVMTFSKGETIKATLERQEQARKRPEFAVYGKTEYEKARDDIKATTIGGKRVVEAAKHIVVVAGQKYVVSDIEKGPVRMGKIVPNLMDFWRGTDRTDRPATNLPPGTYVLDLTRDPTGKPRNDVYTADGRHMGKLVPPTHGPKRMSATEVIQRGEYSLFLAPDKGLGANIRRRAFEEALKGDALLVVRVAATKDMMPIEGDRSFKIAEAAARSIPYLKGAAKEMLTGIKKDVQGFILSTAASMIPAVGMGLGLPQFKELGEANAMAMAAETPDEIEAAAQVFAKALLDQAVRAVFSNVVNGIILGKGAFEARGRSREIRKLASRIDAEKPGLKMGRPGEPLRQHLYGDQAHALDFARITGNKDTYKRISDLEQKLIPKLTEKNLKKLQAEDISAVKTELSWRRAKEKLERQGKYVEEQPNVPQQRKATREEINNLVREEEKDLSSKSDKQLIRELAERRAREDASHIASKLYNKMVIREVKKALSHPDTMLFEADYYSLKGENLGRQWNLEYTTKGGYRALITWNNEGQILNTFDVRPEGTKIGSFTVPSPTDTFRNRVFIRGSDREWLGIRRNRVDENAVVQPAVIHTRREEPVRGRITRTEEYRLGRATTESVMPQEPPRPERRRPLDTLPPPIVTDSEARWYKHTERQTAPHEQATPRQVGEAKLARAPHARETPPEQAPRVTLGYGEQGPAAGLPHYSEGLVARLGDTLQTRRHNTSIFQRAGLTEGEVNDWITRLQEKAQSLGLHPQTAEPAVHSHISTDAGLIQHIKDRFGLTWDEVGRELKGTMSREHRTSDMALTPTESLYELESLSRWEKYWSKAKEQNPGIEGTDRGIKLIKELGKRADLEAKKYVNDLLDRWSRGGLRHLGRYRPEIDEAP